MSYFVKYLRGEKLTKDPTSYPTIESAKSGAVRVIDREPIQRAWIEDDAGLVVVSKEQMRDLIGGKRS